MKKVIEELYCDVCNKKAKHSGISIPVRFLTEQTEGKYVEPYLSRVTVDLCEECLNKIVVVEARGCMGDNTYTIIDNGGKE